MLCCLYEPQVIKDFFHFVSPELRLGDIVYMLPDSLNNDMLEGDISFFCRAATQPFVTPYNCE